MLNTPVCFFWVIDQLVRKMKSCGYQFPKYPFYDWIELNEKTFGSFSGGPLPRYSSIGIDPSSQERFGNKGESGQGEIRLCQVVKILYQLIQWVDGLAGMDHEQVTMGLVREKLVGVHTDINRICNIEMNEFRLGVFLTLASGAGMLKPGKHLHRLLYPVRGMASSKHLMIPNIDLLSEEERNNIINNMGDSSLDDVSIPRSDQTVPEESFGEAMEFISTALKMETHRPDLVETMLCESFPCRSLNKKEMHIKGTTTFDLDNEGHPIYKEYSTYIWKRVCISSHSMAYLKI